MEKEIDIRALLVDHLVSEYTAENCSSFNNDVFGDQVIIRSFNEQPTWSRIKKSSFIESIFTGCELPLIVIFKIPNTTKYLLIDGLNRFLTIKSFLRDELRLSTQGIDKATFLENKVFSELEKEAQEYFCDRGIQVLKFSYVNGNLEEQELEAIAKELYIRYNSGIQLKAEEIQKADYQDDYVTQQIEQKIKQEKDFKEKLTKIQFTPQKNSKTWFEATLMYCRLAITSCYAPNIPFAKCRSIMKKIDDFYYDYTVELNKDKIVEDFILNVNYLYQLTEQEIWITYPKLHNKYFTMVTYWLIFHIYKYEFISFHDFDWSDYFQKCAKKEEENNFFSSYRINWDQKYEFVKNYILENYKVNLSNYEIEIKESKKNKIDSFHKLPKYNFQLPRDGITISTLLNKLETERYILRPSYQRKEINDYYASSALIESVLLNVNIPDILVYRHETEVGKTIFEVVDGQQRCFSLLGFLNKRYKNIYQEEVASEKEGFELRGLTILSELNGHKVKSHRKNLKLGEKEVEKIKNGKIRIVYIPKENNPYFSVKDYFTRINKTIVPLKKRSCRYWNAAFDSKFMNLAEEIVKKYQGTILPLPNNDYTAKQFVIHLAYLFYQKVDDIKSFSTQQVYQWLYQFKRKKAELLNHNQEEQIQKMREPYEKAFEKAELLLGKIELLLRQNKKTMEELLGIKGTKKTFTNFLCLYYLLKNMVDGDIVNNAKKIYNMLHELFSKSQIKSLKTEEEAELLKNCCNQLSIFETRSIRQKQFSEKLEAMMSI